MSAAERSLVIYDRSTAPIREVLDAGLAAASDGLPPERWPAEFQIDPEALPPLAGGWDQAWPGILPSDLAAAADALPDGAAERWQTLMGFYGRCFAERHRQLLTAWDIIQGELDPAQVRGTPLRAPADGTTDDALLERLDGLTPEAIARAEELAALIEAENRERLGPAALILDDLHTTDAVVLAETVQKRIASVSNGDLDDDELEADYEQVERLAEKLHGAREANVPYAALVRTPQPERTIE